MLQEEEDLEKYILFIYQVWKVRYKNNQKIFALKEISKVKIIDKKSESSIKNEKELLKRLNNG